MLVSCWGFSSQNLRFSLSIYVCLRTPDCLWFYFFDGYYEICSVLHSSGQYGNSLPLYVFTSPEFSPYHYSHQRGKWKGNALVSSWGASWPFPPVSLTKKVKYYYLLRRKIFQEVMSEIMCTSLSTLLLPEGDLGHAQSSQFSKAIFAFLWKWIFVQLCTTSSACHLMSAHCNSSQRTDFGWGICSRTLILPQTQSMALRFWSAAI